MSKGCTLIQTVLYGPKDTICVEADFGYAHTEDFEQKPGNLENMIKVADRMMYDNKRNHEK